MRSRRISVRGWLKSGPLSPFYVGLRRVVEPLLRLLYRCLYSLWPDASRRALSRSISFLALKEIVRLKTGRDRYFYFDERKLEYFFHSYNNFGTTERCIEIPIIRDYIERLAPRRMLEIGNVTNYYYEAFASLRTIESRTVVDKYEESFGTLQIDIADYRPSRRFDFIFSISTFEHMDSDRGFNPDYVAGGSLLSSYAADNVRHVLDTLLADGGTFVLTTPIGYSEEWDRTFCSDELARLGFSSFQSFGFERRGEFDWHQVDTARVRFIGEQARHSPGVELVVVLEFCK